MGRSSCTTIATLRAVLQEKKALAPDDARRIVADIAKALEHAHRGSARPMPALALEDFDLAMSVQSGLDEALATLEPHRAELGVLYDGRDLAAAMADCCHVSASDPRRPVSKAP